MTVLYIVIGIIVLLVGYFILDRKLTKKEISDWVIDDSIIMHSLKYKTLLRNNGKNYAKLKGWTYKNIYLDFGDGIVYKVKWFDIDVNKSALWRRNFKQCETVMGKKPDFKGDVNDGNVVKDNIIDDKYIDLLSEIECQVYLKQAIDKEDYDLATKIRKQMEKYR
jgi:hypothetical protein